MESLIIDLQDEPLVRFGGGGNSNEKIRGTCRLA